MRQASRLAAPQSRSTSRVFHKYGNDSRIVHNEADGVERVHPAGPEVCSGSIVLELRAKPRWLELVAQLTGGRLKRLPMWLEAVFEDSRLGTVASEPIRHSAGQAADRSSSVVDDAWTTDELSVVVDT